MYHLLLIIAFFAAFSHADQPRLLDNEIGYQNVAFSGGGYGEVSGLNSLLSNPAGIKALSGMDISLGAYNLTHGFYPLFSFGQNLSRNTSYALGYFYNESRGGDSLHQGIAAGFSIDPIAPLSIGAVVFTQAVGGDVGVDMNTGIQYSYGNIIRAGMTLKNVNESRVGETGTGLQGKRKYTLSATALYDNPIVGYYDIISEHVSFRDAGHVFSVKGNLGSQYNMSCINSYAVNTEDDPAFSTSIGFQLGFKTTHNILSLTYALGDIPLHNSNRDIIQTFSINIRFSSSFDNKPPLVFIKEINGKIAPSGDSALRYAYFHLSAKDEKSNLDKWHFVICATDKNMGVTKTVRHFAGRGLPPAIIKWDGRDSSKELLKPGVYTYRLVVTDKPGNIGKTKWQLIEVEN